MNPVFSAAGLNVTLAQVYFVASTYLLPGFLGFLSAFITQVLKKLGLMQFTSIVSDTTRQWAVRGIVAVFCAALNAAAVVAGGGHLSLALAFQSLFSYFAAVTAYEHTQAAPQPVAATVTAAPTL